MSSNMKTNLELLKIKLANRCWDLVVEVVGYSRDGERGGKTRESRVLEIGGKHYAVHSVSNVGKIGGAGVIEVATVLWWGGGYRAVDGDEMAVRAAVHGVGGSINWWWSAVVLVDCGGVMEAPGWSWWCDDRRLPAAVPAEMSGW
nr:hypothetical protein [Tanacetum cinerariifolium]